LLRAHAPTSQVVCRMGNLARLADRAAPTRVELYVAFGGLAYFDYAVPSGYNVPSNYIACAEDSGSMFSIVDCTDHTFITIGQTFAHTRLDTRTNTATPR
jgi:hypothetical protein